MDYENKTEVEKVQSVFRPVYKELTESEKEHVAAIKAKAEELYNLMINCDRYTSLAKTALEESVMWAVKSITS